MKKAQMSKQPKPDDKKPSSHFPPPGLPSGTLWPCIEPMLKQHFAWLKDRDRWKIINLKHHPELWNRVNWPSIYNGRQPATKAKGELNIAWKSLQEMIG